MLQSSGELPKASDARQTSALGYVLAPALAPSSQAEEPGTSTCAVQTPSNGHKAGGRGGRGLQVQEADPDPDFKTVTLLQPVSRARGASKTCGSLVPINTMDVCGPCRPLKKKYSTKTLFILIAEIQGPPSISGLTLALSGAQGRGAVVFLQTSPGQTTGLEGGRPPVTTPAWMT